MTISEGLGCATSRAIALEIRRVADERRMSITRLSAVSGIPRSTLHSRLSGRSELTVAQLVRLAVALDVPAAELVTRATRAIGSPAADTTEMYLH